MHQVFKNNRCQTTQQADKQAQNENKPGIADMLGSPERKMVYKIIFLQMMLLVDAANIALFR